MHRRSTDALEREIDDWERIRRALGPDASLVALHFIDEKLGQLRQAQAVRDRPKVWGRRATDPKPPLPMLHP
jgi:hypothetical protein